MVSIKIHLLVDVYETSMKSSIDCTVCWPIVWAAPVLKWEGIWCNNPFHLTVTILVNCQWFYSCESPVDTCSLYEQLMAYSFYSCPRKSYSNIFLALKKNKKKLSVLSPICIALLPHLHHLFTSYATHLFLHVGKVKLSSVLLSLNFWHFSLIYFLILQNDYPVFQFRFELSIKERTFHTFSW